MNKSLVPHLSPNSYIRIIILPVNHNPSRSLYLRLPSHLILVLIPLLILLHVHVLGFYITEHQIFFRHFVCLYEAYLVLLVVGKHWVRGDPLGALQFSSLTLEHK